MKYKIEMNENYKKIFTIEEVQKVKLHKAESDLQESIDTIISVLCGNCGELLKYKLTWEINRPYPENTFFGDGIEIYIEAWIYDNWNNEVRHVYSSFYDISQICNDEDRQKTGYVIRYKSK